MTTPAGWYDDGSGRQRWWDGTQWTEHFAPIVDSAEPSAGESTAGSTGDDATSSGADSAESADPAYSVGVPESAADAETAASIESVAAVESQSWNAAPSDSDAGAQAPAESPADEVAGREPEASWSASETSADEPARGQEPDFTAPGAAQPLGDIAAPYENAAPGSSQAAPSFPGAAAPAQPQEYPVAPGYPGAAAQGYPDAAAYAPAGQQYGTPTGYPPAYGATTPAPPSGPSILGLVGLGLAALGTILSCIPVIFWLGWLLLGAGFIVSLISLFLKGKKWPGISGLVLSVIGAIIAVVMFFVIVFATVSDVVRDLPTAPPSSDSDTGTGTDDGDTGTDTTEVVEGEMGSPVPINQSSATSEVTIHSATWATSDGSSIPSTNGGYVILDVTFTGVSGTSYLSAFNFGIETAEGVEGSYDYYVDGIVAEELAPGDTVDGKITFDVAQSESYDVIFTNELLQEVTRITVTPAAG